ncbi:DNA-directed RNA polymerase III subunit RPC3, partial [Galemys pyrenaicus]
SGRRSGGPPSPRLRPPRPPRPPPCCSSAAAVREGSAPVPRPAAPCRLRSPPPPRRFLPAPAAPEPRRSREAPASAAATRTVTPARLRHQKGAGRSVRRRGPPATPQTAARRSSSLPARARTERPRKPPTRGVERRAPNPAAALRGVRPLESEGARRRPIAASRGARRRPRRRLRLVGSAVRTGSWLCTPGPLGTGMCEGTRAGALGILSEDGGGSGALRFPSTMTQAEIKLCSLLLQEHFGEIVEKIGVHLIRTGSQPLRVIAHDTGTSLDQVKKALCVLIQHNLVLYQVHKRGVVEYEAQCSRVLRMLRYPRYIYTAKTLYSDTGELVVEELLLNGKMTMSAVVKKVADRLTETMEDGKTMDYAEVSSTFVRLADTHFVQRCPLVPATENSDPGPPPPAPTLVISEKDMYLVPKLSLIGKGKRRRSSDEDATGEPKAKRPKHAPDNKEPIPDDGIYWQANLDRFHQHFRDQAIVSAVANRMDQVISKWQRQRPPGAVWPLACSQSQHDCMNSEFQFTFQTQTSSEIVRTMLRMSEVTTPSSAPFTQPLSSNEIFRSLPVGYNISKQILDQYLTLLADDPSLLESLVTAVEEYLHKALTSLATATLESVVQERFGSRCARIFRLVLQKKHLEQKQVEDFAMIPAKEAKDMLYKMLSENFISLQEIPKTPDHAPSRTFYLYTVNILSAARMLLHRCYKSIANLIERRQFETKENKRLLEKSQRVEAIIASMQATGAEEAQLQEIEEMITAPERQQLETLKRNVNKLDASEIQVDETIFLLESYIESTVKRL